MPRSNENAPRHLMATVKAAPDGATDYDIEVVCSTGTADRENEIIDQNGWDLASFRANPVFMAAHQHRLVDGRSPVIGSFRQIGPDEQGNLSGRARFADTELGREYRTLYRDGHMRAVSVGFLSRRGEYREPPAGAPKGAKSVYVHTDVELWEVSAVAVGANRDALARLRELGLQEDISAIAALEGLIKSLADKWEQAAGAESEELTRRLRELREDLTNQLDELKAMLPDTVNPGRGDGSDVAGARDHQAGAAPSENAAETAAAIGKLLDG